MCVGFFILNNPFSTVKAFRLVLIMNCGWADIDADSEIKVFFRH